MMLSAQHRPDYKEFGNAIERLTEVLRRRRDVIFAFLYGSAAEYYDQTRGRPAVQTSGPPTGFRDLDIGIFVDHAAVPENRELAFAFALADELAHHSPYPVDVRVINHASPAFRYRVTEGEVLMTRSEEALAQFRESAWDEFLDFRPLAREYIRQMP